MKNKDLINMALEIRKNAYVPYSNFAVGAILVTKDDTIFKGCNIENASYGLSNCAEKTAFFKAISEGYKDFSKIVIVGGFKDRTITDYAFPCGMCRQIMTEFCNEDFIVIVAKNENDFLEFKLKDLLPYGFNKENLK